MRAVTTRLVPAVLAVVIPLTGCAGSASSTASQTATGRTSPPSEAAATPVSTTTTAPGSAGSGHVIHVNLAVPLASAPILGSTCDAAGLRATGTKAATIPGSRLKLFDFDRADEMITPLGDQPVPPTGTVAKPISDDPAFPAACIFSFDVPTTAAVEKAYVFALGSIYFPVPLIPRAELEAAGWIANIGVNPQ